VVSRAELVLDEHEAIVVVFADEIGAVVANTYFSACRHQLDLERLGKERDVLLRGKPRREVVCFAPPNRPHINAFKSTKPGRRRHFRRV